MRRTAILKNNSTAEKRREEEAFALASIAHYCFVETKTNCEYKIRSLENTANRYTVKRKIKKLAANFPMMQIKRLLLINPEVETP